LEPFEGCLPPTRGDTAVCFFLEPSTLLLPHEQKSIEEAVACLTSSGISHAAGTGS